MGQPSRVLFISTYPPVKCGIASFTQDLVQAIERELTTGITVSICALGSKESVTAYKHPVSMVMDSHDLESCIETAQAINSDKSIKMVCIEHEFGLYGGEMGAFLLGFLALIEKPFIIRFHTVLGNPEPQRRVLVQKIGALADKVIVMTQHSAAVLVADYELAADKIMIIPHGTHANSEKPVKELKLKRQLENRLVLCTFGLLSPNKGIEKGILAMRRISERFPDAVYVVVGQTHPNLLAQQGEQYRNYLQQLIADNHLEQHVRLINDYVPTDKLMEYLALTDVYLFTSRDPQQAVSGTFLYAMSAGCAIISNSFVLASEMLDADTGIILQTDEVDELADHAIELLDNEALRISMGHAAFLKMRETTWQKVAKKHAALFSYLMPEQSKPVTAIQPTIQINS